jgi:hypothetical protein
MFEELFTDCCGNVLSNFICNSVSCEAVVFLESLNWHAISCHIKIIGLHPDEKIK